MRNQRVAKAFHVWVLSALFGIWAAGCDDAAKETIVPDAGETDQCADPLVGIDEDCTAAQGGCQCDHVCSSSLIEAAVSTEGFKCLSSCEAEEDCALPGRRCAASLDLEQRACVPSGSVPETVLEPLLLSPAAPQRSTDLRNAHVVVDLDGKPWTATWVLGLVQSSPFLPEDMVYVILGGDPMGVIVRQVYFVFPLSAFEEGAVLTGYRAGVGTGESSLRVVVEDYIYGHGFDEGPTAERYAADIYEGSVEITRSASICEDSQGDCETFEIKVDVELLVWNLTAPQ